MLMPLKISFMNELKRYLYVFFQNIYLFNVWLHNPMNHFIDGSELIVPFHLRTHTSNGRIITIDAQTNDKRLFSVSLNKYFSLIPTMEETFLITLHSIIIIN